MAIVFKRFGNVRSVADASGGRTKKYLDKRPSNTNINHNFFSSVILLHNNWADICLSMPRTVLHSVTTWYFQTPITLLSTYLRHVTTAARQAAGSLFKIDQHILAAIALALVISPLITTPYSTHAEDKGIDT